MFLNGNNIFIFDEQSSHHLFNRNLYIVKITEAFRNWYNANNYISSKFKRHKQCKMHFKIKDFSAKHHRNKSLSHLNEKK